MFQRFLILTSSIGLLFVSLFFSIEHVEAAACTWENSIQTQKQTPPPANCLQITVLESGELDVNKAVRQLEAAQIEFTRSNDSSAICTSICAKSSDRSSCSYSATRATCPSTLGNTPEGYEGPLPDCAFSRTGCRDINDLVEVAVNVTKILFSFMGSIAFVMFMYGGILMISSFGNAEQFKKGQGVLIAAIVGIAISLSAYLVVEFILDALNISSEFRSL